MVATDNFTRSSRTHNEAVAALRASYDAIAPGETVRLAKRTSNLFRPRSAAPVRGLDTSGLDGVIRVDVATRTADVQGMCTYETLVAATLAHGLMPLVVPQLKSITLGGAVTGLGIESTSFRNGLPHESVLEMDILTGDGELVTVSPADNADLYYGFPNSYGSLGYAVRLRIELEPVQPYVALHHLRFEDLPSLAAAIDEIAATGRHDGEPVDFLDGVMFSPAESYLTLGRWATDVADAGSGQTEPSDYTGQQVYYRSLRERSRDCLTVSDYLWRWDTDWFWCSGAFGAQNKVVRRLWPARYRRSDVYYRLIRLDQKLQVGAKIDRWRHLGARERVVQDVEVPIRNTADFLAWFADHVPMSPVWLCPLKLRPTAEGGRRSSVSAPWPLYPLADDELYVNVGFWGTVLIADGEQDGDVNRRVERAVAEFDGHKSLYSDAYYDRATFDAMYGGSVYSTLKEQWDPARRLTGMYEKAVGRR